MISLICVAASVLFTAAVIAAREGRYEEALVCLVLFVINTVLAALRERKNDQLVEAMHRTILAWAEAVIRLRKEFDDQKGGRDR